MGQQEDGLRRAYVKRHILLPFDIDNAHNEKKGRFSTMNTNFQNITHAAQRKMMEKLVDVALSKVSKDR